MGILKNDFFDQYCQIPNELITDSSLSNGAFRVLCLLFSKPNNWKVYNKSIMKDLDIKKTDTLSAYWKECIESGWLERTKITDSEDGTIGAYDYSLNLSPKMVGIPEDGIPDNRVYPKNGEHNKKNSYNKTEESNINPLPLCINPQVWAEWVQHRKEIKKPLTPSTIKKQIAQLEKFDKLGMDTTEIINASISAGYVGLFALRTGKKYQPPQHQGNKKSPGDWIREMKQEQLDKQNINDAEMA